MSLLLERNNRRVVPWRTWAEWHTVWRALYDTEFDRRQPSTFAIATRCTRGRCVAACPKPSSPPRILSLHCNLRRQRRCRRYRRARSHTRQWPSIRMVNSLVDPVAATPRRTVHSNARRHAALAAHARRLATRRHAHRAAAARRPARRRRRSRCAGSTIGTGCRSRSAPSTSASLSADSRRRAPRPRSSPPCVCATRRAPPPTASAPIRCRRSSSRAISSRAPPPPLSPHIVPALVADDCLLPDCAPRRRLDSTPCPTSSSPCGARCCSPGTAKCRVAVSPSHSCTRSRSNALVDRRQLAARRAAHRRRQRARRRIVDGVDHAHPCLIKDFDLTDDRQCSHR
jgi:hypothetical protein